MEFEKKIGPLKIRYGGDHALPTKQRLIVLGLGLVMYLAIYFVTTKLVYAIVVGLIPPLFLNRYFRYKNAKKKVNELTDPVYD